MPPNPTNHAVQKPPCIPLFTISIVIAPTGTESENPRTTNPNKSAAITAPPSLPWRFASLIHFPSNLNIDSFKTGWNSFLSRSLSLFAENDVELFTMKLNRFVSRFNRQARSLMKFFIIFIQFRVLYGFYLAGQWLGDFLNLPLPGRIIGFLLLFA